MISQQQISTATKPGRHLKELRILRDIVRRSTSAISPRVLSFGCSTGYECMDIVQVMPEARVFGCDVDSASLSEATSRCQGRATFFMSTESELKARGPFDLVVAFNVFCRYPATSGKENIAAVYPIALMNSGLEQIAAALEPGGVLALYNSPYFFESTSVGMLFDPSGDPRFRSNGWIEKCTSDGTRSERLIFVVDGTRFTRDEYFDAIRAGTMATGPEDVDIIRTWLRREPPPGSLSEVAWVRRPADFHRIR